MANFNSNTAYDLSLFAPAVTGGAPAQKPVSAPSKPEIVKEKPKTKKELQLQKRLRHQKMFKVFTFIAVLLFCGALKLQSEVQISKLANELAQETVLLETAESERVRLSTKIETEYSFAKVQDYIKENGMQKTQSHQRFDFNALRTDKVTNYLGMPVQ